LKHAQTLYLVTDIATRDELFNYIVSKQKLTKKSIQVLSASHFWNRVFT